MKTNADICRLYGILGQLAFHYHTDIIELITMPIDALYFHFSWLKLGMEMMGGIPSAN